MKVSELDKRMAPLANSGAPMIWHEPSSHPFRLTGFPWYAQDALYRRLPLNCAAPLPSAVDQLANCTAGGQVSFQSDSTRIAIRVELAGLADMNHMPATGQCGFDLYIGAPLKQRFHNVAKYDRKQTTYELLLFEHPDKTMRSFTLNFPLYQGVKQVQIGLTPEAKIAAPPAWSTDGKIVFYGTSITQGGCASRPGMAYTHILSRALNMEVINLGFSGSGRGEANVVKMVADVPHPKLIVLDYEANSAGNLANTLPNAIRILRDQHTSIPILVVSRIPFSADATHHEYLRTRESSRAMQAKLVRDLQKSGDTRIYFVDGSTLLGTDFDECTVDGIHPTDLGFSRIAKQLEIEIRKVLDLK